jgi:nucleotide-binding universal stress UspA family protein
MVPAETVDAVRLDNILYLTDFSEASDEAAPFVDAIARQYGSRLFVLHVVKPDPYVCMAPECADAVNAGIEKQARAKMQEVSSLFEKVPHEAILKNGPKVWPIVRDVVERCHIDLICAGTHGRSGLKKLWLGSVAEEVFRHASVPVMTVGPMARKDTKARLQCILLATDFESNSLEARNYAVSLACRNQSRLILLHVIAHRGRRETIGPEAHAEASRYVSELLPDDISLMSRTELILKDGDLSIHIIEVARGWKASLIVLGIHRATHFALHRRLEETTAYSVASFAPCPVLTVRT